MFDRLNTITKPLNSIGNGLLDYYTIEIYRDLLNLKE